VGLYRSQEPRDVTEYLERDGLAKFDKSWSELGATVVAEMERQRV
jgi:hypothetical protein